jgi:hypothetical protein
LSTSGLAAKNGLEHNFQLNLSPENLQAVQSELNTAIDEFAEAAKHFFDTSEVSWHTFAQ